MFAEDGWRDDSPSDVRQVFGKIGWQRDRGDVTVSVGHANNSLTGNGLQDVRLLDRDYASIYTKPDTTDNRSTLFNVSARRQLNARLSFLATAYYRDIRTNSVNGDINEESLDQSLYQPGAAERAALAAPLNQVVTRTVEGGIRAGSSRLAWYAGAFRAENRNDILFVTSEQTGFGYFKNFGKTRRQGLELGARSQVGRLTFGAGYTFLSATFESEEAVNGESNSTNDTAEAGERGLEGVIEITPGDRLPFIPNHLMKIFGDVQVMRRLSVDLDLVASSGSYARGNETTCTNPTARTIWVKAPSMVTPSSISVPASS